MRELIRLSTSIDNFTNDLFKCIADEIEDDDFVFSALSAHYALSMCLLGAKKNTAKEMRNVLRLNNLSDLAYWKQLLESLEDARDNFSIASKMFDDKTIFVKKKFKNDLISTYNTAVEIVDFAEPQSSGNVINKWCEKQTNDKIKEIVDADDIDITKMTLANAVYFTAAWENCWNFRDYRRWQEELFYVTEQRPKSILRGVHSADLFYKELNDWDAECLGIPYQNKDFLFLMIIPKKIEGLENIQKNIDKIPITYEDLRKKENRRMIVLSLPVFEIGNTLNLDSYLKKMGMIDIFSEEANLKGISQNRKLNFPFHVSGVIQKSFIHVEQDGMAAAAFTTCPLRGGEVPSEAAMPLLVKKPFLFKIINLKSRVTLFSGRISKPYRSNFVYNF